MHNNSQQIKLFDPRFVANTLRNNRRCPKCRSEYSCLYDKRTQCENHVKSNRPFLLPCGHNMCENCVYHHRQKLECCVCLRPIEIPTNQIKQYSNFQVRDIFDMNFFLLGQLNHLRFFRFAGSINNTLLMGNSTIAQATTSADKEQPVVKCNECENTPAVGICRQCKVHYCKSCFQVVHMHSKVLKKHTLDRRGGKMKQMPKPLKCPKHGRMCDRFCRECRLILCGLCAKNDHNRHGWITLLAENERTKDELNTVLEIVKISRDSLRNAQKDVKSIETQLEEYATQTLEDISKFFLQLHSFLQNEERQIVNEFNTMCDNPQAKIRETYTKLNETQTALNTMRTNLEFYQHKPPHDILLSDIVSSYNHQWEQLHCQVQISKINANPFVFEAQRDMCKDFAKYYRHTYKEPDISIRIGPMYGDLNRSFQDTLTQSSMDLDISNFSIPFSTEDNKQQNNKRNQQKRQAERQIASSSDTHTLNANAAVTKVPAVNQLATSKDNYLAHISYVKSPELFYIQMDKSMPKILELSNKYVNFLHQDMVPKSINVGYYYMAYHVADKQWYRAMVRKIISSDLYKIFLVDVGMHIEVPKKRLCDLEEQYLRIPFAAVRCCIHDIMPYGKGWNSEANNLLIEITRNKLVRVSLMDQIKDNIQKVDLFTTHTEEPISVRDSFLYTGLARERPGASSFKLQPKKMSPVARINQRISKHVLHMGDMLTVKVTHIDDPQEFYVVMVDQISSKKQMWDDLNYYYGEQQTSYVPLYTASLQVCCAVYVNEFWHRGCVEKIEEGGNIRVRLVDEGRLELVHWRKISALHSRFRENKEFAIKCSLADIEPLQKNNYAWTDQAIKEFKQLASNPILQLAICSAKPRETLVTLHVNKKHVDINVGAVLAKYGHGLSTGEATQVAEVFKTPKKRLSLPTTNPQTLNDAEPKGKKAVSLLDKVGVADKSMISSGDAKTNAVKMLKRTPIKFTHIVNPGEFYIQLASLIPGITNFHQQLQQAHRDTINTSLNLSHKEWFVGDHCMVYATYKNTTAASIENSAAIPTDILDQCEWYRGIIVTISYESDPALPYVVFLRDIGAVVSSIGHAQLHTIIHQWDRVTNAVYRCHLACIEPTGGMSTWSHSSIDCFKHSVFSFETLSATLQGKCSPGSNSMPIVLWGTTSVTTDPLAPCISKHSNINRILVKAGLAHLVERIDITQQMDKFIQMELAEGEISLEEWFNNFSDNAALKAIETQETQESKDLSSPFLKFDNTDSPMLDCNFSFDQELCEINAEITSAAVPPPEAWLRSKSIEKSIFTAYPTYLDYDCIIYLHGADDRELLTKMRAKIMKAYGQKQLTNELEVVYSPGQACIALYHLDKHFYRGIVQEFNEEGQYEVQFIDYGNVEEIDPIDMRPYAPFPNLPAMASRYRIEGIRPKNGETSYPTSVLDAIHKTIVDKVISVRVPTGELSKTVKKCSMRIGGGTDLGQFLIDEGFVDPDYRLPDQPKANEIFKRRNALKNYNKLQPLMEAKVDDADVVIDSDVVETNGYDLYAHNQRILKANYDKQHSPKKPDTLKNKPHQNNVTKEEYSEDEEEINNCLDQLLNRLDSDNMVLDTGMYNELRDIVSPNPQLQQTFLPPPPPPKKRMFESHEFEQMHAQRNFDIYPIDIDDNLVDAMDCEDHNEAATNARDNDMLGIDDDDQDIVKLEESFALNYWHAGGDSDNEEDKENNQQPKKKQSVPQYQKDIETLEFEKFCPHETSSVFSHFSGIESFKRPQLPQGMRNFNCTIVTIITPTIVQIYPQLNEFVYRDLELQRRIKHLAKTALPLNVYEPGTICLSCYTKDKKWYRAVIRSFNPAAKHADVLYVDYLNTEAVPVNQLRQCPLELVGWPLRTFRVRLYGLQPNPRMREKDVRQALHNIIARRPLYARIIKEAVLINSSSELDTLGVGAVTAGSVGAVGANSGLMEIALYESSAPLPSPTVYDVLIQENFYNRS